MSDGTIAAERHGGGEAAKLGQTVSWLEEQRRLDKDQLARLAQETERATSQLREVGAELRTLAGDVRTVEERIAQVSALEDVVRQVKDQVTVLQKVVEESMQSRDQSISVLQTEAARAQSIITELHRTVRELGQRGDTIAERVNLISHEMKNDRAASADMSRRLDAFTGRLDGLLGKIQLTDEQFRKWDARLVGLERDLGLIHTDQERRVQWEQAAELRWARQGSDWQARAEGWHKVLDEQNRVVQQYAKQLVQMNDDIQNLYRRAAETTQLSEERGRELRRLESVLKVEREEANRVKLSVEEAVAKLEALTKAVRQTEEGARQREERVASLQRALEFHQERIDSVSASLGQADQRQLTELTELLEDQHTLKARVDEMAEDLDDLRQALAAVSDRAKMAVTHLRQLAEQHRARQIGELQRQLQELRDGEGG